MPAAAAYILRPAVGVGRHVVADGEGQHHEAQSQHQQGAQGPPGPQAAGAQDGVFGALGQPRHHEDGADQHRDGQQLVEVAGHQQGDIEQGLGHAVVQAVGAALRTLLMLESSSMKSKKKNRARKPRATKATDFSTSA
jgi:hypothetical protein